MLNIYLLRHGETAWNADGNRYCGRTDLSLTEKGIEQAKLAGDKLKNISFNAVYASPLQRAVRTAEIAGKGQEVIPDNRLIEIDFGSWEGKTKEEFISENKSLWDNWMSDPANHPAGGNGETANEVMNRVNAFYGELINKWEDGKILVVAHNGINRLYLAYKLGMPLKNYRKFFLDNADVTWFTLDKTGEIELKCLNGNSQWIISIP
ncbi:MAG: histidine phosphatase family protein [Chitinophagaceae bacterium]